MSCRAALRNGARKSSYLVQGNRRRDIYICHSLITRVRAVRSPTGPMADPAACGLLEVSRGSNYFVRAPSARQG